MILTRFTGVYLTQVGSTDTFDSNLTLGTRMKLDQDRAASKDSKRVYEAPELVALGAAKDITRNVNQLGGGDAVYSLLRHS